MPDCQALALFLYAQGDLLATTVVADLASLGPTIERRAGRRNRQLLRRKSAAAAPRRSGAQAALPVAPVAGAAAAARDVEFGGPCYNEGIQFPANRAMSGAVK